MTTSAKLGELNSSDNPAQRFPSCDRSNPIGLGIDHVRRMANADGDDEPLVLADECCRTAGGLNRLARAVDDRSKQWRRSMGHNARHPEITWGVAWVLEDQRPAAKPLVPVRIDEEAHRVPGLKAA